MDTQVQDAIDDMIDEMSGGNSETEGGLNAMCKIMEDIVKEENQKILREENIKCIVKMISKGYSKEEILDLDYTEEEYEEAEKGLLTTV